MRIMTGKWDSFMCISFQLLNKTNLLGPAYRSHHSLELTHCWGQQAGESDAYAGRVFQREMEDDSMPVQWVAEFRIYLWP